MTDLHAYAAIAEIFGACAIVGGAIFGGLQIREFRQRRRCHVAADLCRAFREPSLAAAIVMLSELPDGLRRKEIQARGADYQEAAQMVGMTFETMGILVQKDVASLRIVQELTGGLLLMQWRKIEYFIKDTRIEQNNPRFGEWMQWLVDRIEERESDMVPAFIAYADSQACARAGRECAADAIASFTR